MAMYRNPSAAMNVLMGGQPTPEETEIASRVMNQGLSSIMGGGQPPAPAPVQAQAQPQPQPQMQPQMPPRETDEQLLERMQRSADYERRGAWLLQNADEPVPWNESLTWGDYLNGIREEQGPEAADTLIDEQIKMEGEEPVLPEEEPTFNTPVLPTVPMADPSPEIREAVPRSAQQEHQAVFWKGAVHVCVYLSLQSLSLR